MLAVIFLIGAAFFILPICAMIVAAVANGKSSDLRRRVSRLEEKLKQLETSSRAESSVKAADVEQADNLIPKDIPPVVTIKAIDPKPESKPESKPKPKPVSAPKERVVVASNEVQAKKTSNTLEDKVRGWLKRFFTTGNVIARVGIIILFIGVAFLLKYAAGQGYFPVSARFIATIIGSFALMGVSYIVRQKNILYAKIVAGGGAGIFYITIFAAFFFYHFISPEVAFVLLLAAVACFTAAAVLYDAPSLAILGAIGGFIAPLLVFNIADSQGFILAYYLVLNAGILAASWFKSWRVLNLVGFFFTFILFAVWTFTPSAKHALWTSEAYLNIFFVLYLLVGILFTYHEHKEKLAQYFDSSLVFGLPIIVLLLQVRLLHNDVVSLAMASLFYGVIYLGASLALWPYKAFGFLKNFYLAIGVAFTSLAVPLYFGEFTTALVWSLEGLGLFWMGAKYQRWYVVLMAAALQALAGLELIFNISVFSLIATGSIMSHSVTTLEFAIGALVIGLAGIATAYLVECYEVPFSNRLAFRWGMSWWIIAGLTLGLGLASDKYVFISLYGFCVASCLLFWLAYECIKWKAIRSIPLSLLAVLIVVSLWQYLLPFAQFFSPIAWYYVFAGVLIWLAMLYRYDHKQIASSPALLHAGTCLLLLFLMAYAIFNSLSGMLAVADIWSYCVSSFAVMLIFLAFVYIKKIAVWPFKQYYDVYKNYSALAALICVVLLFILNLTTDGSAQPLVYIPILNPIDITTLLAIFVSLKIFQYADKINEGLESFVDSRKERLFLSAVGFGVFCFVWFNALILRTFHQYLGVPFNYNAFYHSQMVEITLSVVWMITAVALMIVSNRLKQRVIWMAGATVLVVVLLKLIFVDFVHTDMLAKTVIFIVVGALMLLVGYFSPLPPKQAVKDLE